MARSEERTKSLLLAAILGVLVSTVVVQRLFERKREAAQAAQSDRPEARAQAALHTADRAILSQDLPAADAALADAQAALDALLAERPTDPAALRGRLLVARRRAAVAEQRGLPEAADAFLADAWRRAQALFEAARTAETPRLDLLAVGRDAAAAFERHGAVARAGARAEEAAAAVEGSLAGLSPPHSLRVALADTWLLAAQAHGQAKLAEPAVAAAQQALKHAQTAVETSDQPESSLARLATVASEAARLAAQLEHPAAPALEERVIGVLRARLTTAQDPDGVRRTLSIWLGQRAERLKGSDGPGAQAALEEAVALRAELVKAHPADLELRADWSRALNAFGAFLSEQGQPQAAAARYGEAAAAATALPHGGGRLRLIALGNQAHVLGRADLITAARPLAAEAWALAGQLVEVPQDPQATAQARADAARAGLRHAQLLRAAPRPDRRAARAVVEAALALIAAPEAAGPAPDRAQDIRAGLERLRKELGGG